MKYAADTAVSVDSSRTEIERTLARYGAAAFAYATEGCRAVVAFRIQDPMTQTMLAVRITLPLPSQDERRFTHTESRGIQRHPDDARRQWEQACRSSWRSLCLVIKAKLEACASGISTVEREFLADVVTPDGRTIGDMVRPQLAAISERGEMPKLLLGA